MSYTITLVGCKGDEIELISMVMELCGLDMNAASNAVDHMPSILFENVDEAGANKYKKILEDVGAILKIDEAVASAAPQISDFPEPDFGKVMAARVAPEPVREPEPVKVPEPVVAPEPVKAPEPVSKPEPVHEPAAEPEPAKAPARQSVIEITPRSTETSVPEPEPVRAPEPAKTAPVSSTPSQTSESSSESSTEEPKYEYYGYCPKCGSSFVTVKKVGGLFGSNKVKCVCEACKHKF